MNESEYYDDLDGLNSSMQSQLRHIDRSLIDFIVDQIEDITIEQVQAMTKINRLKQSVSRVKGCLLTFKGVVYFIPDLDLVDQ